VKLLNLLKKDLAPMNFVQAASSAIVDATGLSTLVFQPTITVDTPTPKTFAASAVNVTDDEITITAHGYLTGTKVQISNPGTLPVGISAATDYFVIVIDANTIQLALSLVDANAGTPVDITGQGVGTNTSTATALAGATVKIQKSLGEEGPWEDDISAVNITVAASPILEASQPVDCNFYKLVYAITAGELSAATKVLGKGLA
jgi:hypothetical protein